MAARVEHGQEGLARTAPVPGQQGHCLPVAEPAVLLQPLQGLLQL